MTTDGLLQKTFAFDATNMLKEVVDSNLGTLQNEYNGLGFRVASTKPDEKIEYLCDLSRDYYNLLERTVNGETESFIYDNNVVSMSKAGRNYYYLQDELGSPMYLTGTDGTAVSSYAFDDFGRNIDILTGQTRTNNAKQGYAKQGNIIQPFAFTGYQEDEISGLKFAQARFYDADNGRFVGEDQVRGYIGNPDTINHYLYCMNKPNNGIDANGKEACLLPNDYVSYGIDYVTYSVEKYFYDGFENYNQERIDRPGITLEEMQTINKTNLPDYTKDIDEWLFEQQNEIQDAFDTSLKTGVETFYNKVKDHGEMDIKRPAAWRKAFDVPYLGEDNYFLYHGVVMNASTLGNVTFAYAGRDYFPEFALYSGAAYVQIKNRNDLEHLPMMYLLPYWGDAPEDHEAIELGIKWKKEGFCDE